MALIREDEGDGTPQKLSHKQWKKLKRKQKRQALAKERKDNTSTVSNGTDSEKEEERRRQAIEEENMRQHLEWERRDNLAHQQWLQRQEQEKRERQRQEETERKIREEWEERERRDREEREKEEKEKAKRNEKQHALLKQATKNENQEWHNPLAPVSYNSVSNSEIIREVNKCPFFTKTGACRFGDRCSRVHVRPDSSTTLLIAGMFESFELIKSSVDDYDTDMNLEYEDSELVSSFREFYQDVIPEFKSVGKVVNLKVCCNHEPHLRGNVYVQYRKESEAHDAFIKFNARWYAGRQLTCEFVDIAKWKSAICGLFFAKKCPKGKTCNFLHVFRNPGNEFWEADRDFDTPSRNNRHDATPVWRHHHHGERHSHRRLGSSTSRSRSRSRTRESSRSYSSYHRSSRNRSRSPISRSRSRRKSTERSSPEADRKRNVSPRHSPHRERARSRSRETAYNGNHESRRKNSLRPRSRSRSASRDRSRERDCAPFSRKRSRSRSCSEESRGTEKKAKKSKHKKSKKSMKKKKKKSASSPGYGPVSFSHLGDGSEEEEVELGKRDSEVKGKDGKDSDDGEMEVTNGGVEENGVL